MKPPSLADRVVKVHAYLTDETFGYDHWRAAQVSPPQLGKPGLLTIFDTEAERDAAMHPWQPLETAKQDGHPILLGWDDGWQMVGWFIHRNDWPLGWWWHGCEEEEWPPLLPTHWQELPPRPPRMED